MQKLLLSTSIGVLLFGLSVSAQQVNIDSLTLISKISADQLKLGKLQNAVYERTKDKQDGAIVAQQSADKNSTAATRLSDDPMDKKTAQQASSAASNAKSDAKKARKASDKLDDLNKDIADLKAKIAQEQQELNRFTQPRLPAVVIAPPPVVSDTTQHN